MTKLSVLLAAAAAGSLLPTVTFAACVATGTIPRISLTTSAATVAVRANAPGTISFVFTTTHPGFLASALAAQSSHQQVSVTGGAAACGAPAGGASTGGSITAMVVAP